MNLNYGNIDDAKTFEEIADFRLQHYLISKANKFNFNDLLTGIYEDKTHFIYELIQNAEDANAKEVRIKLLKDTITLSHDGDKLFDLADVKSITGIADSSKQPKDNNIGKFGIGFKAIFGICDSPKIYSGDYAFEINNLYVPKKIEKLPQVSNQTVFVMPFKSDINHVDTYNEIKESLENLTSDKFLFLKKISKIYWNYEQSNGVLERKIQNSNLGSYDYSFLEILKNGILLEKYLSFKEQLSFNQKLYVSILYRLNPEKQKPEIQLQNIKTKLHVFFPTKVPVDTKFIVHGPYLTTHTREQVLLTDQVNKDIFKETLRLYKKSLLAIKEMGLFSLDLLMSLPIEEPEYELVGSYYKGYTKKYKSEVTWYRAFYDSTINFFQSEPFLITSTNTYCLPSQALLARGSELMNLLDTNHLSEIYGGVQNWISSDVTIDKTPEFRKYLRSALSIREIDFDTFLRDCPDDFFEKQTDEWLMNFYLLASNNIKTIKDNHLGKKYIRLETGQMVAPFTGKTPNAFLPSRVLSDKNIGKMFVANNDIRIFFEGIGLTTLGIVEQIRDFIEVLVESPNASDYLVNLEIIFQEYIDVNEQDRNRIIEVMNSRQCILSENLDGTKSVYTLPSDTYLPNENNYTIFGDIKNIWFLNKVVYNDFLIAFNPISNDYLDRASFLRNLKINESLKVIERDKGFSNEDKEKLLKGVLHTWIKEKGYQIEHIDGILNAITKEKSRILWDFISRLDSRLFKGNITWHYGQRFGEVVAPSFFILKLQKTAWLYDLNDKKISPNDIYYDEVAGIYGDNQRVKENIRFKPNIVKTLPIEEQTILNITKGIPLDILESLVKQYQEQALEVGSFNPVDPSEVNTPIVVEAFKNPRLGINEKTITTDSLDNNGKNAMVKDIEDFLGIDIPNSNVKTIVKTITDKGEKVGKWGEEFVFKRLRSSYENKGYEIINLSENQFNAKNNIDEFTVTKCNFNDEIQKGYDISIEKDEYVEYIEVKTREGSNKKSFNVSGTQWEFAKSLELIGKGNQYSIYLVTNAGTKEANITVYNNPYKNWIDGNLDAHPIAIKL